MNQDAPYQNSVLEFTACFTRLGVAAVKRSLLPLFKYKTFLPICGICETM